MNSGSSRFQFRRQEDALGEYLLVEGVREAGWPVWRQEESGLLLYRSFSFKVIRVVCNQYSGPMPHPHGLLGSRWEARQYDLKIEEKAARTFSHLHGGQLEVEDWMKTSH